MDPSSLVQVGVLLFCALISVASAVGVLFPRQLCKQVRAAWQTRFAMGLAVGVRVVLGTMLIYFAPYSKFPMLFRVVGLLGLVAAVGLPLIGWRRVDLLMGWLESRPIWMVRAWTSFGVCLGVILFYGAMGI